VASPGKPHRIASQNRSSRGTHIRRARATIIDGSSAIGDTSARASANTTLPTPERYSVPVAAARDSAGRSGESEHFYEHRERKIMTEIPTQSSPSPYSTPIADCGQIQTPPEAGGSKRKRSASRSEQFGDLTAMRSTSSSSPDRASAPRRPASTAWQQRRRRPPRRPRSGHRSR
jgi:hypothetical protein